MIKIIMQPTIDIDDVCNELNLNINDFECAQMAENGSYIIFDCSDDHVEELLEDLAWQKDKGETPYYHRLANDYALINFLRGQGIFDYVLIYVSW